MNAKLPILPAMAIKSLSNGPQRPGTVRERPALRVFSTAAHLPTAQASVTGNHGGAGEVAIKQKQGVNE